MNDQFNPVKLGFAKVKLAFMSLIPSLYSARRRALNRSQFLKSVTACCRAWSRLAGSTSRR
ncbi:hypothetical protein TIFTF001_040847 [Ficus carica]|uniref:Uncharacterized protein n=1 Tax=Ficus carica TaxID=3494 RepID=A0AA87ZLF2_FICCA|nr:hypothetical protein TIFTF001_040847 [Ficus carica]